MIIDVVSKFSAGPGLLALLLLLGFPHGGRAQDGSPLTLDKLFSADHVLQVEITVPEEDWDTIRKQRRDFGSALSSARKYEAPESPYTYVTAAVTIDGVTFPKVGLRKKGFFGSQNSRRPSLKIKLDQVTPHPGIGGLRTLTFNNNNQDPVGLSQFMGYALFEASGSPAPRCSYAKITVNGNNLGIYSHVESARRPLAKRGFGDDRGTLFEGTVVDFYNGWEGSFERKFGSERRGRARIKDLITTLSGGHLGDPSEVIMPTDVRGRAWVPTDASHDENWMSPEFDDSSWREGRNGAGFEGQKGFEELISEEFNFTEMMEARTTTLYLRFPFEVADPAAALAKGRLVLRMKYDDGFVAYLNGHKVGERNAPKTPQWNSKATSANGDPSALTFEAVDLSAHASRLKKGRNVLAIHGMNSSKFSSDMLMLAELRTTTYDFQEEIAKVVDLDAFYRYWAMEGLLGFWDGYSGNANNYFVYLNPKNNKFHFVPWGADALFQKFSMIDRNRNVPLSVKLKGLLGYRLYQTEAGRKRYRAALMKLLKEHWDEDKLLAETDRIHAMLKPHQNDGGRRSYDSSRNKVREFIRTRKAELLDEIKDGMPVWTKAPTPPPLFGNDRGRERNRDAPDRDGK